MSIAAIGADPEGCTCANTRRSLRTKTACPGMPMYSSRSAADRPAASSTRNVNSVRRFGCSGSPSRNQTIRPPSGSGETVGSDRVDIASIDHALSSPSIGDPLVSAASNRAVTVSEMPDPWTTSAKSS
jgi:hypothetical protein